MSEHSRDAVVLPFYFVCDVSGSMSGSGIAALTNAVNSIYDLLRENPIIADVIEIGVITFSDSAQVVIPAGTLLEGNLPTFSTQGGTKFSPALTLLKTTIEADRQRYTEANIGMYRPVVFFLTDGGVNNPSEWQKSFGELTHYNPETKEGFKSYPTFVPMGLGQTTLHAIKEMPYPKERSKLYIVPDGRDVAKAVEEMTKVMMLTVVTSGANAAAGTPQLELPTAAQLPESVVVYNYDGTDFVND